MAVFADVELYEQKKDGHTWKGLAAKLRERLTKTESTSRQSSSGQMEVDLRQAVRQMEVEGRNEKEATSQIGAAQAALL